MHPEILIAFIVVGITYKASETYENRKPERIPSDSMLKVYKFINIYLSGKTLCDVKIRALIPNELHECKNGSKGRKHVDKDFKKP
jgi:hypothetical protein